MCLCSNTGRPKILVGKHHCDDKGPNKLIYLVDIIWPSTVVKFQGLCSAEGSFQHQV